MSNKRPSLKRIPPTLFLAAAMALFGHLPSLQAGVSLDAGDDFTAFVDNSGNLYTFGANGSGQLGIGTNSAYSSSVVLVEPAGVWSSVSASKKAKSGDSSSTGEGHILAIRTDGSLWAWGDNSRGQLGNGTVTNANTPQLIDNAQTWVEVEAGADFSMARNASGQVYVWGDNTRGQLARTMTAVTDEGFGSPETNIQLTPDLLDGNTYSHIAAGLYVAFGIRTDGSLWTWGYTETLQFGQPQGSPPASIVGPATSPIRIGTYNDWTGIEAGNTVAYGFKSGRLFSWGGDGHLGRSAAAPLNRHQPFQVGTAQSWSTVSIGHDHVVGTDVNGLLLGWGSNQKGQLGLPHYTSNGTVITGNFYIHTPTTLNGVQYVQAASAGFQFSTIYTQNGFLLGSGLNDQGQMGNGITLPGGHFQPAFTNSTLGLTDLAAISINITTPEPSAGSPLDATVLLKNLGTGTITDNFSLGAVLATTPNYSAPGAVPLVFNSGQTITTDLAPGVDVSAGITLQIPPDLPIGEYYLVVQADTGSVLTEVTRANNDVATDTALLTFSPDIEVLATNIVVTPISGPFPLGAGDTIEVQATISNIGNGAIPASSDFDLRYFVSSVPNTNDAGVIDLQLPGDVTPMITNGLAVGASNVLTLQFQIPDAVGIGDFYLGVFADSGLVIAETNENNNLAFTTNAVVEVIGIDIAEAVDNFDLNFVISGDGDWFGATNQALIGAAQTNNAAPFGVIDAAVSPPISGGQRAVLSTTLDTASLISFRWRSDTTVADNKLTYSLLGAETGPGVNSISGDQNWQLVERVAPAGVQVQWTYIEGVDSPTDKVFVDDIQITPITGPDFVVDSAQLTQSGQAVDSGRYVLGRDRLDLSVLVRNQGLTHPASGADYDVRAYLSLDNVFDPATDILVYSATNTGVFLEGASSLYLPSILLPVTIPDGQYRLVVVIDETNAVTEVSELPAPDEVGADVQENNVLISPDPNVEIVSLPDLRVSAVNPEPGFYVVGESIPFDLTLQNIGYAPAIGTNNVLIVLSSNSVMDASDYIVGEFAYIGGLAAGGETGDTRPVTPDVTDVRSDIPFGDFLYFGVIIDSENDFEELDESNNTAFFLNPYFIFGQVELDEAMELDVIGAVAQNNETQPFAGDKPFVGQTVTTFDTIDAAQSSDIDNGQTAAFQTTVVATSPSVLTFNWKVSSEQQVLDGGAVKEDTLNVYINNVKQRSISGEVDWSEVRISLDEPGTYVIKWTYEKDGTVSDGLDTGWVDNFRYTVPDLAVTDLVVAPQTNSPGDTLNFTFRVTNVGNDPVPQTPSYGIDVRLSTDPLWGGDDDVIINVTPELRSTLELAPGEFESFSVSAALPPNFANTGTYYVGVRADPDPFTVDNPDNGPGAIPETDENNNTAFTVLPVVTVIPQITLDEAIDDQDPDDPDPTDLTLIGGGDSSWFGLDTIAEEDLPDGTLQMNPGDTNRDDIAQSGPIGPNESSYFETQITGPAVLKFRWKVDSRAGVNILETKLNGDSVEAISGRVDWDLGFGAFTLTYGLETTPPIPSDASAATVQAALNALPVISLQGGVGVTRNITNGMYTYDIIFNVPGNRPLIQFTSLDSSRVLTSFLTDSAAQGGQNGSAALNEVQVLGIEPNVFFALLYKGESTSNLTYLADAALVETALNDLSTITADGGVTVADHPEALGPLDFLVTFNSVGERDLISVDADGLKQPVTVENSLTADFYKPSGSAGVPGIDGSVAQVQPLRIGSEITIFVPSGAGAQTVRWSYQKTGTAGDFLDAGWVDQVQIYSFGNPELVLQSIDYTPGQYVLDVSAIFGEPDQLVGTENLAISVAAVNQGVDLPLAVGAFTSADLDVRLSSDRIYGNADDVVLGTFTQFEGTLEAGDHMRFIGPLPLGDQIPEGFYYLMAKIDANERITEYDTENNIFITENRDVEIDRRPRLELFDQSVAGSISTFTSIFTDILDFSENKHVVPKSEVTLRFQIQNSGLDDLYDDETGQLPEWKSDVKLGLIKRQDLDAWIASSQPDPTELETDILTLDIGSFTLKEPMEGRRAAAPDGDVLDMDLELYLPTGSRILQVLESGFGIMDYVYFFQITLDSEDVIEESSVINIWNCIDPVDIQNTTGVIADVDDGLFNISTIPITSEAQWEAIYGVTADETIAGPLRDNFLAYAFGRNPLDGDTAGAQYPGSFGFERKDTEDYLGITFDFPYLATDLIYTVESAGSMLGPWTPLVVINGPYDDPAGPQSLTSDGGLVDEPQVTVVVDGGDHARVTVIDDQPEASNAMRFIRMIVETVTVDVP